MIGAALRNRQPVVTEEPFRVHSAVRGRALASLRRRALAVALDGLAVFVISIPLILAITLTTLQVTAPALADVVASLLTGEMPPNMVEGVAEAFVLLDRARPGTLPARYQDAVAAGGVDAVREVVESDSIFLDLQPGDAGASYFDPEEGRLHLRRDILFGRAASMVSVGVFAIGYFTSSWWLGRGRSPGKWLCGVRIVRLDGKAMTLSVAFGRAGAYTAVASTLGTGFFSAARDPNLQTVHDRASGTVVVRDPRRTLRDAIRGRGRDATDAVPRD